MSKKTALLTMLGNHNFDTRFSNLKISLRKKGIEVTLIGFDWLGGECYTKPDDSVYKLSRVLGPLSFYGKSYLILFIKLFFSKFDYYFVGDVFLLPLISIIARLKKGMLFYDARELFGHLASLQGRSKQQQFWATVEKRFIGFATGVIVTGKMDGEYLSDLYQLRTTILLRNLPMLKEIDSSIDLREKYSLPKESLLLIQQGVVQIGRGFEPVFKAMKQLPQTYMIVLGSGELIEEYKTLSLSMGLEDRVVWAGRLPQNELLQYTAGGDIGLAVIENISKSYYYALPNKMFEYIMTGVPVIASSFPQMKQIIDEYRVGYCVEPENIESIVEAIKQLEKELRGSKVQMQKNLKLASEQLHWENDFKNLEQYL